ncbi:MAG: NAD(P)/FAD-dependent oxidoreductase, partial [Deltaproteobacteria bacterium]
MYDYIIVGGGITGLELGALLAHDGNKVLLLEQTKEVGGRALLQKRDGYTVEYGIHLIRFGPKSAISRICRHLGHEVKYADLGKSYLKDEDGKVKVFPTSPGGFLTSKMFTLSERLKLIKLMTRLRRESFADLKSVSVKEWMDREGIRGGMRRYFTLVSASMMVCPFIEKSSIGEMLTNMQKVLQTGRSVMYPLGGWEPLFNLFLEKIKEKGEVRVKTKVDRIVIEEGKAVGVKVGEELIRGKAVITCVPCQKLFPAILSEEDFPDDYVRMCKSQRPTSGVVLDYGIKRKITGDSGLWYMWNPISFGIFTSNLCPELVPEGKQLLTWIYPTPREDMEDSSVAKNREEELERALFELFPELEKNIEWRRALHLTMVDGVEVNIHQTSDKRPGFKVPGVESLFLLGDSTSAPGAGGDVGHESALECYKTITGREV